MPPTTKTKLKPSKRRYGWIRDLPDQRDRFLQFTRTPYLPDTAQVPWIPPIYDQGALGSCTANAIANAYRFAAHQEKEIDFNPSRLFVYYNERRREGTINFDAGASIRDGMRSIAAEGICSEECWPYTVSRFKTKPPPKCYKEAINHQAIEYLRFIPTLQNLKACIAAGYPFIYGFTVYESFESDEVAKTGVVPMPEQDESRLGGHAVYGVAYDDATQRFTSPNSWGTDWGKNGLFTIPYSYLTDSSLSSDFWTLKLVEV